ncbi:alkaline phosphatase PhoX [Altererythrobacter sp. ZODW24]|uniref:alkaline phosphatase PhoX n=1 Tax=Altererythrobacter sp. ZODW24 TaxID=2185142 RepID=UPI000DF780ED|nr:alkaline phosphatase PhoX [Altererythrobacter sp. ZODW24]
MTRFQTDRRIFMKATGSAFAALLASGCMARGGASIAAAPAKSYGPLVPDPAGFLDLPQGFSYKVLSSLGDAMSDGGTVPDKADGMGCFKLPGGKLALVRNHELVPGDGAGTELKAGYGTMPDGTILPGGTTTIVLDAKTLAVENQFRSMAGTMRNCSGGITPWGSWLTCEEPSSRGLKLLPKHGYVFEIPAAATGMVDAQPLKAMGRFNHEAAAVDPAKGIVYLTEDEGDSLFYRFIPTTPGKLADGGVLQALVIEGGSADTRNKETAAFPAGADYSVRWTTLGDVENPEGDLRNRGAKQGAAIFARGEGLHYGDGELYFCCTSGGAANLGQIFRLTPGLNGKADKLQLFFESTDPDQFNYGDNLCVGPNGHLVVCEDQYTDVVDNHLRGLTPDGEVYDLARLNQQTELAGACFSPDGKTMFVNSYSPTATVAITGPWIV